MSTLITAPPRLPGVLRKPRSSARTSIWSMTETWIATVPLLFLVARGTFSFQAADTNVPGGGVYGSMLAGSAGGGAAYIVETFLFYLVMCGLCLLNYKRVFAAFSENKFVALLPLYSIATTAWSSVPSRSISYGIMALINTAFAFYLAKRFSRAQQLELFIGLGTIALISSFVLVAVYPAAAFDHKGGAAHAVQGLFGHKNHCAMVMLLLLVPAFYVKPAARLQRILRSLYIAGTMLLIVVTTSRTGWLLLAITIVFVPLLRILSRMRQKDRFVAAFIIVSLTLAISILGLYEAANVAIMLGKDPTFTGRTEVWQAVMRPIFKRPLTGYGYYAFWTKLNPEALSVAMSLGSTGMGNAENGILQMWLEMGGIGLGILFLILGHLCKMSLVCFRRDKSGYMQWGLCMVFLGIIYGAIAGDKFMHPHTIEWTILVMVYVGIHDTVRTLQRHRLE